MSEPPAISEINQDPTMARRAFVVNAAVRDKVRHLAGVGVGQDDIAKIIGCAPKTLRKRCRDDLDRGVAEANATVSGYLFAAAKAGNVTAQIFWLKTRAQWQEKAAPDHPVPGVKPFLVDDARQRLIDEVDRVRARKKQKGE